MSKPLDATKTPLDDEAIAALLMLGFDAGRPEMLRWEPPALAELQRGFPQFEMHSMIGRGGMGAVYKCWQRSLERFVAIKILPPEIKADDPHFTARFEQEAKAMARLSHPGLVAVYDAGETASGLLYFVMEFIEGADLQRMVAARGRLAPAEVLPIMAHVCNALQAAHESGFIHRDIKPSNIMVDVRGQVKVTDFGLARPVVPDRDGFTFSNVIVGTPEFVAPEAFTPGAMPDERVDLYALGVTLYQMLTGRIPRGRFEMPSGCVPGLDARFDAIVDRAMQSDPARRYATALELRADLDLIVANPVTVGLPAAPAKKFAPHGMAAGWLAAVAVTALAIGGFVWSRKSIVLPVPATTAPAFADILTSPDYTWSAPENLGPGINSKDNESALALSEDELDIVFCSAPGGHRDLYETRRGDVKEPFRNAAPIREVNTPNTEGNPFLSGDGFTLLYMSVVPAPGTRHHGRSDIYQTRRHDRMAPWEAPVNLGGWINTSELESAACLSPDGLQLILSTNRPGGSGGIDLWRSRRESPEAPFPAPENLGTGVNADVDEGSPFLAADRRTLLLTRQIANQPESGALFVAVLDEKGASDVRHVEVPVAGGIQSPWLSRDGRTLYFSSNCPGGLGGWDLWKIHRIPKAKLDITSSRVAKSTSP